MSISHNIFIVAPLILCLSWVSFSENCHPNDKKVLVKLKKDLNNPPEFITWESKTDCCTDWYGLKCDEKTNRIIQFTLFDSDRRVPIPAAFGNLPYLESLTIRHAKLTGRIPLAISKLSNLNSLDLRQNLLTGPIPSFLGNLKKLTYIGLSFNRFTGSIPASLSQLPELSGLLLQWNHLTGSIPETFGDFKQQNFYLYMSGNQLSGPIPRKLDSANFTLFDVSSNRLEGDLSFMFGKSKSLANGYFSRNLFEFDFSKVEVSSVMYMNLDLIHNKIYGSIPKGFTKLDQISLDVSYNRLCGQIPVGGRLQQLKPAKFMHNKCLCGSHCQNANEPSF